MCMSKETFRRHSQSKIGISMALRMNCSQKKIKKSYTWRWKSHRGTVCGFYQEWWMVVIPRFLLADHMDRTECVNTVSLHLCLEYCQSCQSCQFWSVSNLIFGNKHFQFEHTSNISSFLIKNSTKYGILTSFSTKTWPRGHCFGRLRP